MDSSFYITYCLFAEVPSSANCLAACPFSQLYFLIGFNNGVICLYSRLSDKPLMIMSNKNHESSIKQIEWSHNKPCVFYTRDSDNKIHVWNLAMSDINPIYTIEKKNINYLKLIPPEKCDSEMNYKKAYMVRYFKLLRCSKTKQTLNLTFRWWGWKVDCYIYMF